MAGHKDRDHAILSPSSAHRWMTCTPSAQLETQFPDTESEAAAEGILAERDGFVCEAASELDVVELLAVKDH